jgi:D-3-phosphoglycerate dehydrogenase
MKALLLDYTHELLEQGLEQGGLTLVREYSAAPEEFPLSHFNAEVIIIRSRIPVDAAFIDKFPNLKAIGRLGAGLENIDTAHAASKNIACLRVPEGNAQAVAEHALGMLLSLINHLPRAQREVREGLWKREENKGRELHSMTVGVIGYGVMGSRFVQLLTQLGIQVLVHDKYKSNFSDGTFKEASLEELQRECHCISLHLPLTEETRYYADRAFFQSCTNPIYFINTARGPILETAALVAALQQGKVLGAGLDVLEYEKRSFTSLFDGAMPDALGYLLEQDNVIITPHIAGWTKESFEKMGRDLAKKVIDSL